MHWYQSYVLSNKNNSVIISFTHFPDKNVARILTPVRTTANIFSAIVTNTVNKSKLRGEPVYWDLEISNHTN